MWMALTLGFFGSVHCLGMCGPLAMGVANYGEKNRIASVLHATSYNVGRIVTYAALGGLFGLIGEGILISGFQKIFSIIAGVFLIVLFLFSMDLERVLFKSTIYKSLFTTITSSISKSFSRGAHRYPLLVGMLNGLLPCGLVYLALAGSLTMGHVGLGAAFMVFFGLGTFPVMIGVMLLGGKLRSLEVAKRNITKTVFPILHLFLGVFLIYRGVVVDVPVDLDFWMAVKHPVMCH